MRAAAVGEAPPRGDEQHRPARRHAAEQGRQEAEGGRQVAGSLGRDLVQGPEGKAALRQVRIESGQPEGQGTPVGAHPLQLRQQAAQGGYGLGTALMSVERHGTGRINGRKQCRTKIEQCKNYQACSRPVSAASLDLERAVDLAAERLEQALHQPRAGLDRGIEQVLVVGMGAVAIDAQAVERCDALGGGQIAVGAAAGQAIGFQLEAPTGWRLQPPWRTVRRRRR